MFYNYLTVIFRNFLIGRVYTMIIVLGLAIGVAAALMIAQYVFFELSFDKHYKDRDQIYYSYIKVKYSAGTYDGLTHPAIGPLFKRSVPEVESFARMTPLAVRSKDDKLLRREEGGKIVFYSHEGDLFFADAEILNLFSIPMVSGNAQKLHGYFLRCRVSGLPFLYF